MTTTEETFPEQLLAFINAEVSISPDPIEVGTDLLMTGAVDSLGVVRVTQWLEDELGFEVDPIEVILDNFQTVDKMVAYARSKMD